MQFPKLTPLQSRLAACLGTSVILVIIYLSLSPSHFAYAAELDSILHDDHNHHRIGVGHSLNLAADIGWSESGNTLDVDGFDVAADYQAEFPGVSRELVGRAPPVVAPLKNNNPSATNIAPGETNEYVFASSEVYGPPGTLRTGLPWSISRSDGTAVQKRSDTACKEGAGTDVHDLLRRQATNGTAKTVYISVNTCTQPSTNSGQTGTPPQLTLYYSVNESTTSPSLNNNAVKLSFEQGYASAMVNATGNVYFSVVASNLTDEFSGQWHYSIAASIDASYFYYEDTKDTPFIWTVDTDSNSALLATRNLTDGDLEVSDETKALREKWMKMTANPPFTMKIFNTSSPNITGIERSYCGWNTLGMNPVTISYNMTQRGVGQNPKQQFYATGLQPGQNYTAILAYDGVNSTNADVVAGGGQVWKSITFTTKTEDNCKIIYDLPFCDAVAYAVPTNPKNESLTVSELKLTYDNYASALFQNFTNSLDQIQCQTAESAQYSLATNCTMCSQNYKLWLCAVTIPRCEDFSSPNTFLQPRNIGHPFPNGTTPTFNIPGDEQAQAPFRLLYNSSRNPMIDQVIKPGPYKELLPCQELCFDLVQACPMALQFTCPKPHGYAAGVLSNSYGSYDPARVSPNDFVTCNFLGVDWPSLSEGRRLGMTSVGWSMITIVVVFLF